MKNAIAFLMLFFVMIGSSHAAVWAKLRDNNASRLMLDKQSILQKDQLKRAWIKIEYKTVQKNLQSPEKEFNLSKLLWFFDCSSQKSATSQVFQYLNGELVYSAGIDVKSAEFIEPVPETDVDIAMHYVCSADKSTNAAIDAKPALPNAKTNTPSAKPEEATKKPAAEIPAQPVATTEPKPAAPLPVKSTLAKSDAPKAWSYEGKAGPQNWGKLTPEFATCDSGRNQSPINIEDTMHASLKPLRGIHNFPAKDIFNDGHTVQVNFTAGNMLVLDNMAYQMKQVHFHAPSENTIRDKSFPLEAHFVHADAKGNLTVIGVMFKEGKANPALAGLWSQMPKETGEPVALKSRVTASELIPKNRSYYRFSGSLTTPPCSEGVRWLLLKTPMTASKAQIEAFEQAIHHHNNRPVQALNGRMVVE